MKRMKSQKESVISSFFFAVYPFSVHFQSTLNTQYQLYFEKNAQILNKIPFPSKDKSVKKSAYFKMPQKIISFRILSQKNMIYKWSIYHIQQKDQQFIESQQFDLKEFWDDLIIKKQNIKPYQTIYKKIKLRLSYLVVGATTHKEIQQEIFRYFNAISQEKTSIESPIKMTKPNGKHNEPFMKNDDKMKQKRLQKHQIIDKQLLKQVLQSNYPTLMSKTSSHILSTEVTNEIKNTLSNSKKRTRLLSQQFNKDQFKLPFVNELDEIGNQIERKIKQDEERQQNIISKELSLMQPPDQHEQLMLKYRQNKRNGLTDSQLLNEKGEVIITPFYIHFKYYMIIIVIIAIFYGLILMNPQSKSKRFKNQKLKMKKIIRSSHASKHKK